MVVAHSMGMMNFYSATPNGATICCSMNFFTAIKAMVSVQATRLAGQDLLQCCFSSQECGAKTIRWEFRVLGTGRLYHWVTSRLNVVDLTHHSFPSSSQNCRRLRRKQPATAISYRQLRPSDLARTTLPAKLTRCLDNEEDAAHAWMIGRKAPTISIDR